MNPNRSCKIVLAALLAAQSFWATAQTNNAAAPVDYSTFSTFIAQRNIFDPNRVPNVPWVPRTSRPAIITPQVRQPDSFSLVGIIGYGEGRLAGAYAFFDGTNPQYHRTVQINGSIANFKVADIAADSVTLMTDTNNRTVLRIGEQLHDDGSGHWLTANGNGVRYDNVNGRFGNRNGNGGRRQRNNNFGGFNQGNNNAGNFNNNNGNFNRRRNNFGGTASTSDNSQAQDPNMNSQGGNTAPDDNTPPDNMAPLDDNTAPDPGQQNN
jgi:hypothetical protein